MIRIPDELFEGGHDAPPAVTAMPAAAPSFAQAREAAALTGAGAVASRALHDLDRSFDDSATEPKDWATSFETEAARIRDEQVARLPDPRLGESFAYDFDDLAAAKLTVVRRLGIAREVEDARAGLDEALGSYAGLAAGAASGIEARIVQEQADAAIVRMEQAGFLRPGEADDLQRGFLQQLHTAQIDRLIEDDPRTAVLALSDPAQLSTLTPDLRVRLRDRAESRAEDQEREQAQREMSERQERLAGLMVRLSAGEADRAEIVESAAQGWLRPAERERALALWVRQRDEIRQRDDDIARVSAALDGIGSVLDPDSKEDRRALDLHFADTKAAWLAAGLQETQLGPVLVDYLARARAVPSGLRRDMSGAFRAGAPEARSFFAELCTLIFGRPGRPSRFFDDFIGRERDADSDEEETDLYLLERDVDPGFGIEVPDQSNDVGFGIDIPDQSNDNGFDSWPARLRPQRDSDRRPEMRPIRFPQKGDWSPAQRPSRRRPWRHIFIKEFESRDLTEGFLINSLIEDGWPRSAAPDRAAAILGGTADQNDRFVAADKDGLSRYLDALVAQECLSPEKRDEIAGHAGLPPQGTFNTSAPSDASPPPESSPPELIDSASGQANPEIADGKGIAAPPAAAPADDELPQTGEGAPAPADEPAPAEAKPPPSMWERLLQRLGIMPSPGTVEEARGLADNLQRFADKDNDENRAEAARVWADVAAGRASISSLRDENGNLRIGAYTIAAETADILERIEGLDPKDEVGAHAISRAIGRGDPNENGLTAGQRAVLRDMLADKVKTGRFRSDNPAFSAFDIARLDEDGSAIEQRAVDRLGASLARQIDQGPAGVTPPVLGAVKAGGKSTVSTVERRQHERIRAERGKHEEEYAESGSFSSDSADTANDTFVKTLKARNPDKVAHPPYLPGTTVHEFKIGPRSKEVEADRFIRLHTLDNPEGRWLVRREDVIDSKTGQMLRPEQLRDKFALPETPTLYNEVTLPPGTAVRMGIANPERSWGKGRGLQYQIISTWQSNWFGTPQRIAR